MKGLQIKIIIILTVVLLSGRLSEVSGQSQAKFQTNVSPVKTDDHQPEWDFYLSNVDEKMSSLFVDLGLYKVAPLEDKWNFLWVSVRMNDARLNGLASSAESEILRKMEEKLVAKLYSKFKSIYAGNLTSNGSKDFYFYIGDTTNYTQVLSEFILAFPSYKFEYGAKTDENWSGYFDFLYPSPQQFQSIQNRRIIDQLEKNGDKLTQMREVDHWIYFKTKRDRDQFLEKIKFEGFSIVSRDHDKKSGGLPFKLHITRIDKVDWNSVDAYVIYLWKLANEFNGVYDGWETSVKKN